MEKRQSLCSQASGPLLRSRDRGDVAEHERAMVQAVRSALSPCLAPGLRCARPCRPGQVPFDDRATGAAMLSCSANRPMRPLAWQRSNRCQERDVVVAKRGDQRPTRVRFAVQESKLRSSGRVIGDRNDAASFVQRWFWLVGACGWKLRPRAPVQGPSQPFGSGVSLPALGFPGVAELELTVPGT